MKGFSKPLDHGLCLFQFDSKGTRAHTDDLVSARDCSSRPGEPRPRRPGPGPAGGAGRRTRGPQRPPPPPYRPSRRCNGRHCPLRRAQRWLLQAPSARLPAPSAAVPGLHVGCPSARAFPEAVSARPHTPVSDLSATAGRGDTAAAPSRGAPSPRPRRPRGRAGTPGRTSSPPSAGDRSPGTPVPSGARCASEDAARRCLGCPPPRGTAHAVPSARAGRSGDARGRLPEGRRPGPARSSPGGGAGSWRHVSAPRRLCGRWEPPPAPGGLRCQAAAPPPPEGQARPVPAPLPTSSRPGRAALPPTFPLLRTGRAPRAGPGRAGAGGGPRAGAGDRRAANCGPPGSGSGGAAARARREGWRPRAGYRGRRSPRLPPAAGEGLGPGPMPPRVPPARPGGRRSPPPPPRCCRWTTRRTTWRCSASDDIRLISHKLQEPLEVNLKDHEDEEGETDACLKLACIHSCADERWSCITAELNTCLFYGLLLLVLCFTNYIFISPSIKIYFKKPACIEQFLVAT
ncbi:sorting nexin-7 isoform X1 [Falco cherrug]|uniref:sorting nexin-7 isoform X1 n=1 Tax=Falco cherrug TaxID=345164 RepID=UPI00247A2BDE|nr:sorting nexin-7 isoform X1 [Falco cherrug]